MFIATLDKVGLKPSWNGSPKVLEDVIPPLMLAVALSSYLKHRWNENIERADALSRLNDSANGDTMAQRLVKAARDKIGDESGSLTDIELKGGIIDVMVQMMMDTEEFNAAKELTDALQEFEKIIHAICRKLQCLLAAADTRSRRDRLQKNVRLAIERFEKSRRDHTTKADVERCLQRIDDECTGNTDHARNARENVLQLRNTLDNEVSNAGDYFRLEDWLKRLRKLWEKPWYTS